MKNVFGNNITLTLFGESHGEAVGCVIDGIAPGIKIDNEYISSKLLMRAARSDISTARQEPDTVEFLSGIKNGYTEGTPVCIVIRNTDTKSSSYSTLDATPRPSHADYTAECKYGGFQDKCGGGHFSGRLTAPLVAAGAIISYALLNKGIKIGTHIKSLHGVCDRGFDNICSDIDYLSSAPFPALDELKADAMVREILKAKADNDSVGGILETAIVGIPAGVGEPWFDTVEGLLAHALFSIPGIKGVEFGDGFALADMLGSEANDPFRIDNGSIVTAKNSSGGINGGITNGMPIVFSSVVRPTPSISKPQSTVNLKEMTECEITVEGRHDPAIIHRARAVVDAVSAIVIADLLVTKYGTAFLCGEAI